MLYAVSPFGMSRIKRTQVRAAFCFSFFCFFRSTHVNQNTAAFFSLSVTRTVYVQSVSRSRMRKIPAHKKIILFYAILPVLSSRVPFRSVRSLGTPQRFYSHILPIFFVFCTPVFKKRPPFSSILYGKLSFGVFISCFFRKILTFWNFPIEKYTNLVYIYLAEERICVSRPIDPKCVFCSLTKKHYPKGTDKAMENNGKKIIYADNAATTAVSPAVLEAMLPYYTECYGNPSSLYALGTAAKKPLEEARAKVAKCLGAEPNEIYFTSCGSESDNWAIKGAAHKMLKKGKNHIITSKFEHHAVLHTCAALEKEGFEVTYLDVHENGIVVPEELEAAITDKTGLVTIMYANNEIGTIQPIPEIGEICKKHGVWFHTDAVQAVGNVPINVKEQNIDMLSLSGHKFHGPKGVGVLYIKKGIILPNLIDGGAQERGRRAGTENVASIVGLSVALENAINTMDEKNAKLRRMQDKLITELSKIDRSHLNGDRYHRLPGNVNFSFEGVEGESMLLMLDLKGVCASSGSACTSGSLDPSHVLLAIGLKHEVAHGSLRLSFSDVNDESDADYIIEVLPKIIDRLRAMSPLWDAIIHGRTIS